MMTTRTVPSKRSKVHVSPGTFTAVAAAIAVTMFMLLYFINSLTKVGSYPAGTSVSAAPLTNVANADACGLFDTATGVLHEVLVAQTVSNQEMAARSLLLGTMQVEYNLASFMNTSAGETQVDMADVATKASILGRYETIYIAKGSYPDNYHYDASVAELIQSYKKVQPLCVAAGARLVNTLG